MRVWAWVEDGLIGMTIGYDEERNVETPAANMPAIAQSPRTTTMVGSKLIEVAVRPAGLVALVDEDTLQPVVKLPPAPETGLHEADMAAIRIHHRLVSIQEYRAACEAP